MATATKMNNLSTFFAGLKGAKPRLLLLDYDGTLAPFRTSRQMAMPYDGVPEVLALLMASTSTRVIFITGRPAIDLRNMLPILPVLEIWGSHGLERLRTDGRHEFVEIPPAAIQLLGTINDALNADALGVLMEVKAGATAVHWRGLSRPLVADVRQRVLRVWSSLQRQDLVTLTEFDGGMEFRLLLCNKGDAVRQILRETSADASVAYLGDDLTDEDAFQALNNRGLSVLVRGEFRPTCAQAWIQPPEGVLQFLNNWILTCGKEN